MFKWQENHSLGITEIDRQHQQLFVIAKNLYDLIATKENRSADNYDEIVRAIDELTDYTIYHFDYEEKLMTERNYPDLEEHAKEHNTFIDKLKALQDQDIDTYQTKITIELLDFVAKWVSSHILDTDKNYVSHLI